MTAPLPMMVPLFVTLAELFVRPSSEPADAVTASLPSMVPVLMIVALFSMLLVPSPAEALTLPLMVPVLVIAAMLFALPSPEPADAAPFSPVTVAVLLAVVGAVACGGRAVVAGDGCRVVDAAYSADVGRTVVAGHFC